MTENRNVFENRIVQSKLPLSSLKHARKKRGTGGAPVTR